MDVELSHSERYTRIIYFPLVNIYIYFLSFQKPGINIELYVVLIAFSAICPPHVANERSTFRQCTAPRATLADT